MPSIWWPPLRPSKTSSFFLGGGGHLDTCLQLWVANKEIKVICAAGLTVEVRLLADRTRWGLHDNTSWKLPGEALETWGLCLAALLAGAGSATQWPKKKLNQVAFFVRSDIILIIIHWCSISMSFVCLFDRETVWKGVGRAKPLLLPRFGQVTETVWLESLLFPSNLCNVLGWHCLAHYKYQWMIPLWISWKCLVRVWLLVPETRRSGLPFWFSLRAGTGKCDGRFCGSWGHLPEGSPCRTQSAWMMWCMWWTNIHTYRQTDRHTDIQTYIHTLWIYSLYYRYLYVRNSWPPDNAYPSNKKASPTMHSMLQSLLIFVCLFGTFAGTHMSM